jgi:hypothetical protein
MLTMTGFTVTRAVVIVAAGSLLRVELCVTHDLLVRKKFLFSRSENIFFVKLWRFRNKSGAESSRMSRSS